MLLILPTAPELMLYHRLRVPCCLCAEETDARAETRHRQDGNLADT